jgi:hypothetical protein
MRLKGDHDLMASIRSIICNEAGLETAERFMGGLPSARRSQCFPSIAERRRERHVRVENGNQETAVVAMKAEPTIPSPVSKRTLNRTFSTAFLLTGNAERAEAAILDAIGALDAAELSEETLFLKAMAAAVAHTAEGPVRDEDFDRLRCFVSIELRRVMRLPVAIRHCFVLRVLVGFPREVCSTILQRSEQDIEESACLGAQELVRIGQERKVS